MEYRPKYIIVHHSAAAAPMPQFDSINKWHKDRDFPLSTLGYFVGYHRVIEADGTVRIARLDTERDCDSFGHNYDSLSVCLAGNLDLNEPTVAQVNALGALLSHWCTLWGLEAEEVFPHRRFNPTSCYGAKVSDNWARLVYLKHEILRLQQKFDALQDP